MLPFSTNNFQVLARVSVIFPQASLNALADVIYKTGLLWYCVVYRRAISTPPEGQSPRKKKRKSSIDQAVTEVPKIHEPDPEKESRTVFIGNLPNTLSKKVGRKSW